MFQDHNDWGDWLSYEDEEHHGHGSNESQCSMPHNANKSAHLIIGEAQGGWWASRGGGGNTKKRWDVDRGRMAIVPWPHEGYPHCAIYAGWSWGVSSSFCFMLCDDCFAIVSMRQSPHMGKSLMVLLTRQNTFIYLIQYPKKLVNIQKSTATINQKPDQYPTSPWSTSKKSPINIPRLLDQYPKSFDQHTKNIQYPTKKMIIIQRAPDRYPKKTWSISDKPQANIQKMIDIQKAPDQYPGTPWTISKQNDLSIPKYNKQYPKRPRSISKNSLTNNTQTSQPTTPPQQTSKPTATRLVHNLCNRLSSWNPGTLRHMKNEAMSHKQVMSTTTQPSTRTSRMRVWTQKVFFFV